MSETERQHEHLKNICNEFNGILSSLWHEISADILSESVLHSQKSDKDFTFPLAVKINITPMGDSMAFDVGVSWSKKRGVKSEKVISNGQMSLPLGD